MGRQIEEVDANNAHYASSWDLEDYTEDRRNFFRIVRPAEWLVN